MSKKLDIKVYLETTIISYLAARPSTDLINLAKQHLTTMWWDRVFPKAESFISVFVTQEIIQGDKLAVAERIKICNGLPVLDDVPEIQKLAETYLQKINIPDKAKLDAYHIACASVHEMDYLLTWNCTHIANASFRSIIESINKKAGCKIPIICTPEELLEI